MIYRSKTHLEAEYVCLCIRLGRYPLVALKRYRAPHYRHPRYHGFKF